LVRGRAWEITDADIEALKQAGFEEDQIFEATVCAAPGAELARLEKGLAVLRQAGHSAMRL
jgi:alkylhydroperoxidase/carboxymuconolactone decarboxylase family protein YurZ